LIVFPVPRPLQQSLHGRVSGQTTDCPFEWIHPPLISLLYVNDDDSAPHGTPEVSDNMLTFLQPANASQLVENIYCYCILLEKIHHHF